MRNFYALLFATTALILASNWTGYTQPPPPGGSNDLCDNAELITCGSTAIGATDAATNTDQPGFCDTDLSTAPGVWYRFVGDGSAVSVSTCSATTNYDTKVGVFEGPCNALVCVAGDDDDPACASGGLQSTPATFTTTIGTDYFIYVTGFGTNVGDFELSLTCTAPCVMSSLTVGAQTPCNIEDNTYTQAVTVEYTDAPATGSLDINGQLFAITGSPQTETLVGLTSNGLPVDLVVAFTDDAGCTLTTTEAWIAPEDCTPPLCADPDAETLFSEDFNGCAMPAGWQNNIITGDSAWLFVLNSPDVGNPGNLDGTCMALFDDDWLGSGAPASNVELVSPTIDLSNHSDVNFAFDFNFNDFTGETFYVDAWDGTTWNNLMTITGDSIGSWILGPPYNTATFSLAGYTNSDFQFRFGYNDNGNWGWYVGIDNIEVCGTPNCPPSIPFTVSGTEICAGLDSTLASVVGNFAGAFWSNGGTGQTEWLTPGNYTVTIVDAEGCTDSLNFDVTTIPNPDGSFTFVDDELNVDFFANSATGTYAWDFGDGNTASVQNPSHTYSVSGSYTVTLIVTENGCTDTTTQTVSVTGIGCSIPTPIITPAGPIDLCPGDSIVLTATNLPAGSGPTIPGSLTTAFAGGNGFDGNMFDVLPTSNITVDDFDVHTDGAGTSGTVEVYYKVGTHIGSEEIAGDWTLIGTAPVTSAGPGNPTNLGLSLGLSLSAGQTYAFYLTATGTLGFDYTNGTAVGNVLATNADVTIYEGTGKEYPFASSFTPRNWNGTMYYSIPGNSDYSLLWSPTGDTTVTTVAYGGTYTVTVDSAGCTATSDPVQVNMLAGPTAAFTSGAIGLAVSFTDLSTGNIVSWDWDFDDGNTSTLQNPTNNYALSGSYDVTLIVVDADGCSDTITNTIIVSSGCNIASFAPGTQTPCDPVDDTYTQEVIITYSGAPTTGTIDVNGQSFAITTSPQTVVLVGLNSDGLPVDVTAAFSDDPACTSTEIGLFTAPASCFDACPGNTTLLFENFNGCALPAGWQNNILLGDTAWIVGDNGGVNNLDGSCMAYFDDDDIGSASSPNFVELITPPVDNSSGDNLQLSFDFNYNHIGADSFYVDVWNGASWDNVLLLTNDSIGFWNGGPYPTAVIPLSGYSNSDFQVRFVYNDGGAWAWYVGIDNVAICQIPTGACEITSATAGTQTPCDPATSTYDQDVIIEYTSAPGTGDIIVNGQAFPITGSPQTVTFTGLPADGLPVDVDVEFSADPFCSASFTEVWTAPADCYDPCPGNTTLLWENFNGCALPAGWQNNILLGDTAWIVGDNGGINNLDGSCMAYFDDDDIGSASSPNFVELITPPVDNSSGDNLQLSFDFNYNNIGADSFYVDVWNGATWDNVLLLTSDSIGTWNGGPYPTAVIPLSGYSNSDFQVRFVYNDGGVWAWYVGIDNVAICQIPAGACDITAATAGTQTPCDPATSTYDQDVIIEYTDAPATGTLDVNGISFPITGSPQTVSFTGLPADGLPVDVDASFSDDPFCSSSFSAVWTAPEDCYDPCAGGTSLLWENFNGCALPAGWQNNILLGDTAWIIGDNGGVNNIDGSCMAYFDDDDIGSASSPNFVELITPPMDNSAGDSLHLSFDFNYNHIGADSFYVDVWNGATWDNVLLLTNDSIGFWNGGPYPTAEIPLVGYTNADVQVRFVYNDGGAWAWYVGIDNVAVCAFPTSACDITSVTAGDQTPCDIADNTYTQEIIVEYADAPATGTLDVNGQSFAITTSPQSVVLTGLFSDGLPVDVTATFSDLASCTATEIALFTAPEECAVIPCPGGTTLIFEDFNGCALPTDWSTNLVNGVDDWQFGDNGGVDNIDGSCMAYFDDDAIGAGASPNWVQLLSPVVDASSGDNLQLTFDFNYNHIGADSFYVDVWNGASWDNVLLLTNDSIGFWNGGPYPTAVIPMAGYSNADFQVRFSYNDGGAWAWYVGIDNVALCSLPVGACDITAATAGTQTPCDPATSTYDQDVIIEYTDAPATGTLDVNGISFPITGSPQTVSFTGLPADGLPVDVSVSFSDDPFCVADFAEVWTAPADCFDPCPGNTVLIWENFNSCAMPTDWSTNLVNGVDDWQFGDNGGVNNLDGSCMAYFDDDAIGSGASPNWVQLLSPVVDVSSGDNLQLSFDFNYNHIGADSFYVDVWNGATWDNVLLLTNDSIGFWNGGPYPTAVIPMAGYTNTDFQVRFSYNDGGVWAWYVGIDNVSLCSLPVGACDITAATAGTQTPCDPATSTYDQDVIIEYSAAPATGTLDVNGISFPITGSPQTVSFTGLPADGLPVDVSVSFSDDPFCMADFTEVWTAPADCYDPCVGGNTLIWENFNDCNLPAGWSNNILTGDTAWIIGDNGGVNNIDGSCMAYFDDDDIGSGALPSWVELVTNPIDASAGDDMQLSFDFNYNHIGADSFYVDVWNGANWENVWLLTSDSIGFWNGGPYPTAVIPLSGYTNADFQVRFVYNDGGVWAWYVGIDNVALCAFPPTGCEITNVTEGTQTPCDPVTSLYDQEVIIEYTNEPATGDLIVNGQTFPITGSPQTVTFTGLLANGLSNDVTVGFSDNPFCSADFLDVWNAPADCFDPCPGQTTLLWESFNSCLLPAGWGNNILTGTNAWIFTDNGGVNNLDGTCMALFDDDANGAGALPSHVELTTPVIDASSGSNMMLEFDFNYNHIGADSFYVDVWDGTQWDNVMLITSDSIGFWNGGPYPHATIPLVGYSNTDFQVRFVYNDGGVWAWYLGIDNVSICEVPPTDCSIDGIVADAQGPCDPVTNEYTQDLIVTYSTNPTTGTLDVNGQSFPVSGSPQTVTLTGLDSDGQPVDVSANFSDDIFCALNLNGLFTAPESCLPIPINDTCDNAIPIICGQSIVDSTIYASIYEAPAFCGTALNTSPGMWYSFIGTGDQINITTCSPITNYDTKLGLFEGPCDSLVCIDGNDDIGAACTNDPQQSAINNFITTPGVEYLIYVSGFGGATGVFELTIECAPPCDISNVTIGAQTPCDPATNTYTQEVAVEYANPPATGFLDVNGQQFAITGSPQTVVLVGLQPNGQPVDANVQFTDNTNCVWSMLEAWTAPEDCTPPPCTDPNAVTIFSEDFNDCIEPAGWENNIITGDSAWWFVLNSPDAFNAGNIDGTCMALFDDDWMGSGANPSHVELVSPGIDLSNYSDVNFAFDFNYNDFIGETFYVDAWDGTTWNNLMTITGDSIGAWALGPPYPTATFSMAGYTNSDFQVRFGYDDNGGNWGWYVGIDNIVVCGTPDCPPMPITLDGLDYCVGEDSALVSVLESYSDYSWSNGGIGQTEWLVAGNYTVTVTDPSGCTDSVNFNVTQIDNPLPPVITITGDTVFCIGGSTMLSGPAGFNAYQWNTGSTTPDITVFDSGTYTLYVVDSVGCESATSSVDIIVNPLPVASFSYTLVDFTINLTNLSLDANSYNWDFGDFSTDTQESPSHTYGDGGVYTITLVASNDCGADTANVTLGVMNIGVQEASGISEFSMYPNPVHDKLIMDLTLIEDRDMTIEFYDQLGQVVLTQQNQLRTGANKLDFSLGHLAQGVYSIRISDDQFTQIVRLVKR